jgi:hypothetical protein
MAPLSTLIHPIVHLRLRNSRHVPGVEKKFIYMLLFLVIAAALLNSFLIDKHFACDGVYYFWEMLEKKDFVHHEWARQYSLYITQWPAVLAIKAGVTDIRILNGLFITGVFSIYVITFLISQHALRGGNINLLIWPLLTMAGINLSTDYHLTGEFPVVMLLSWPILFLMLRERPTLTDQFLLVVLLFTFTRIYQSALTISPVFILLMLYQQYHLKKKRPFIWFLLFTALCLAAFLIAGYTSINSGSQTNKISFIRGFGLLFLNIPAMASVCFIILFFLWLTLQKRWIGALTLIPVFAFMAHTLLINKGTPIFISFSSRTLSASFFPLMMIFALTLHFRHAAMSRLQILFLSLFIIVMVSGNIWHSRDWSNYRSDFKSTLSQKLGFVPVEETRLKNPMCFWNWTSPYLSLAWSEGCVQTIVMNEQPIQNFPYNPHEILWLKRYVSYSPYFLQVDPAITLCNQK